jgi:hypothetical protein
VNQHLAGSMAGSVFKTLDGIKDTSIIQRTILKDNYIILHFPNIPTSDNEEPSLWIRV